MSTYSTQSIIKRLTKIGFQHNRIFVLCIVVAFLVSFVSGYRPMLIGDYINETIVAKKGYAALLYGAAIIIVVILAETILQYFLVVCTNLLSQNVIFDLRQKLFDKLIYFKSAYFDKTPIGVLVTRSVSDIETLSKFFSDGIMLVFGDTLKVIVYVGLMFYINWRLALISVFIVPVMLFITRVFQKAIKKTFTDERNATSELNTFVQERLSGMMLVQLFNRQKIEYKKFTLINFKLLKANLKTVFYFSLFFPIVELVTTVSFAVVVYFGSQYAFVNKDPNILGDLFAFVMYINMLIRPMRQIADRFNTLQRGIVGAERVFKVMDERQYIPNTGTIIKEALQGDIEVKNLEFSYIPNEPVLKDISFSITHGQTVAIVGATGSGKSTIINLLTRFYQYEKGSILIDGVDINQYDLNFLRSQIKTVLQDVFLFHDSLMENITLGDVSISKEMVIEAAKEIEIHDFIAQLPNQYDYVVSERGGSLSVGQRQLISFLRAYIQNPSILILDEATSSVDTESEELIQKALEKITKGRTSIVIAHRLATIQKADAILVLHQGKIVERGTHDELLQKGGYYKKLYEIQFASPVSTN